MTLNKKPAIRDMILSTQVLTKYPNCPEKDTVNNDYLWIESQEEFESQPNKNVEPTDLVKYLQKLAKIYYSDEFENYKNGCYYLRDPHYTNKNDECNNKATNGNKIFSVNYKDPMPGIRPCMHLKLPKEIDKDFSYDIKVSDDKKSAILKFGRYPDKVFSSDEEHLLRDIWEKDKDSVINTGRYYPARVVLSNIKRNDWDHNRGWAYPYNFIRNLKFYTERYHEKFGYFVGAEDGWNTDNFPLVYVNDIDWDILNWADLPQDINPNGTGKAKFLDVRTSKIIMANVPFHPYPYDDLNNVEMWQNSLIRSMLNGTSPHLISHNGNTKYNCEFKGELFKHKSKNLFIDCNFISGAFGESFYTDSFNSIKETLRNDEIDLTLAIEYTNFLVNSSKNEYLTNELVQQIIDLIKIASVSMKDYPLTYREQKEDAIELLTYSNLIDSVVDDTGNLVYIKPEKPKKVYFNRNFREKGMYIPFEPGTRLVPEEVDSYLNNYQKDLEK